MKVGRGFLRLMSKLFTKCTSHGHSPVLYTAALTLGLVLSGCGNVSLSHLLEKQQPGELGITPKTATIDEGSSIEIAGKGGFTPYTFSATAGTIEEIEAVTYYTAPNSPGVVTITVADGLSSEATATIEVVPSTVLSFPQAMTIETGENTGFVIVTGGTEPYTFTLDGDGALDYHHLLLDRVKYIAPGFETTAYVWVQDGDGTQRTLTVTVVEASSN
jgi:VCBS repeat-containing protein